MRTASDFGRSRPASASTPYAGMAVLVVVYLFTLLPSGLSWDYQRTPDMIEGSWAVRLQWMPLFLAGGFMAWRFGWRNWVYHLRMNPLLWVMLAYCALSMAWSALPTVTLKRVVQLSGLMAIAIAIVDTSRPTTLQWVRVTLFTMLGLLAASVVVAIGLPDIGQETIAELAGSWRGVLDQKNGLGMVAAMAALFGLIHHRMQPFRAMPLLLGLGLILLCLIMARSSTSITVAAVGAAIYLLLRRDHVQSPLWLQRTVVVVLALGLVAYQVFFTIHSRPPLWSEIISPVAGIFGKSADLTGRTDIWDYMWPVIEQHWLQGIGYGAFWLGPGSPSQVILDQFYWVPYQSHNGYIDVINELGVIGLLLFVGLLALHLRNLWRLMYIDRESMALHAALLVIVLFTNVTESSIYRGVVFLHVVFLLSCFKVNHQVWWGTRDSPVEPSGDAPPLQGSYA